MEVALGSFLAAQLWPQSSFNLSVSFYTWLAVTVASV